jgi:hypothetical protein
MTVYVENIIRDLNDLIFDVKAAGVRAYENRRDTDRVFTRVDGDEGCDDYPIVAEGLVEASQALDKANDDFLSIENVLRKIVEDIQMEALSAKVQAK